MSFVLYLEVLHNLNGKLTATEKATVMYEPMNDASKNSKHAETKVKVIKIWNLVDESCFIRNVSIQVQVDNQNSVFNNDIVCIYMDSD